ncbi:hypothetical protein DRP53_10990 [candidate division WOR-3 bacterium]|uniref:Peptidase S9 prolyl oligopeptidase catalytic domain-containing protein n=1 Tax=candidate division WOR-3 bacterium TaxID=2052148 RepID=A0A660SDP1_UNCW3|nr:MAG: hypothetical protein DRP53_10990 [candidate division WOR-3 bacterium]
MIRDFDVTWDGRIIVYVDQALYGDLYMGCFDTVNRSKKLIIHKDWAPQGPRVSTDGQIVTFYGNSKIFLYDFEKGEVREIFAQRDVIAGFPELSRDGQSVVFSARGKSMPPSVFICNLGYGKVERITDESAGNRFPHWSFSGRFVAYTHQKLSDLQKLRWIEVYCIDSQDHLLIQKGAGSQCIINKCCWCPFTDSLVYIEKTENGVNQVKLYSTSDRNIRLICRVENIQEVSFFDSGHVLLISENTLQLYSINHGQVIGQAKVPIGQKLLFRPDGAVVRISRRAVYFLTDSGSIYIWNFQDKPDIILQSERQGTPLSGKHELTIRSYDGRDLPVYRYIPNKPNGVICLFIVGGPGESVKPEDDRVLMQFLKEGYELIVPAYRGCKENPDRWGEMGCGDVKDVIEAGKFFRAKLGFKLPIIGYSYGGFLTFLALAMSKDVFSCGISLWGVTSLERISLHLHKVLTKDMDEETRRRVLDERSPVIRSKDIEVPLMI